MKLHRLNKAEKKINAKRVPEFHPVIVNIGETEEQAVARFKKNNKCGKDAEFIFVHTKSNEQIRRELKEKPNERKNSSRRT